MKIIQKSLEIALALFPETYRKRKKGAGHNYHFCFAWYKNKRLIAIGQNNPAVPSHKALKFAKRFNTKKQLKYSYIHAEVAALGKLWGKILVDERTTFIIIRLNRFLELQNSHPCKSCSKVISALGVKVIYSTAKGFKQWSSQ